MGQSVTQKLGDAWCQVSYLTKRVIIHNAKHVYHALSDYPGTDITGCKDCSLYKVEIKHPRVTKMNDCLDDFITILVEVVALYCGNPNVVSIYFRKVCSQTTKCCFIVHKGNKLIYKAVFQVGYLPSTTRMLDS